MTEERYGRVVATSPGKHGPLDWRVAFCGVAPAHDEAVFLLGMLLVAEDRFQGKGMLGRYLLWNYIDRLLFSKTPEAVRDVAEDCWHGIHVETPRPVKA